MIRKLHNHIPTHCTHMTLWQWQPIIISGRTKNCQNLLHHTWPKTNKENLNLKHYFLLKYLTTFVCSSADNLEVNYTVHFILISYVYTFHILSKEQHPKCQRTVFNVSGHVTLILFTSILYLYMQTSTCIMKLWQCLNVTQCDEWIWKNQGRL